MGGHVQIAATALASAIALIRARQVKSIGLLSANRDPTAPELVTVNESSSVKHVEADLWVGLAGPPGLPRHVVETLSLAMREILADTGFKRSELNAGRVLVDYEPPEAFQGFLAREDERLRRLAATVKLE